MEVAYQGGGSVGVASGSSKWEWHSGSGVASGSRGSGGRVRRDRVRER